MCALPHKETTQWASVGLDQQLWLCFPLLFRNHFHWHWQHLPSGRHERTDNSPRKNREPLPPWSKLRHVTCALWLVEKTPNGSIDIFGIKKNSPWITEMSCHVQKSHMTFVNMSCDVKEQRQLICSTLKTVASKNILPTKIPKVIRLNCLFHKLKKETKKYIYFLVLFSYIDIFEKFCSC